MSSFCSVCFAAAAAARCWVCVCVCACVRACVRVCVRAREHSSSTAYPGCLYSKVVARISVHTPLDLLDIEIVLLYELVELYPDPVPEPTVFRCFDEIV